MKLAAVRSVGTARGWRSEEDAADFEQEIIDQHALAMAAAGLSDGYIAQSRAVVFEFRHHLDAPVWQAKPSDADAFLAGLRRAGLAVTTRAGKAGAIARYQGDIHALTEWVIEQPVDEYNRQSGSSLGKVRVPPSDAEIERLFGGWAASLQDERRYLPAARNYFAASLWRRVGVRITEGT